MVSKPQPFFSINNKFFVEKSRSFDMFLNYNINISDQNKFKSHNNWAMFIIIFPRLNQIPVIWLVDPRKIGSTVERDI